MLPVVVLSTLILLTGIFFNFRSGKIFVREQLILRANLLASATKFVVESSRDPIELSVCGSFQEKSGVNKIVIVAGKPLMVEAASEQQWIGKSTSVLPPEYQHLIDQSKVNGGHKISRFPKGKYYLYFAGKNLVGKSVIWLLLMVRF